MPGEPRSPRWRERFHLQYAPVIGDLPALVRLQSFKPRTVSPPGTALIVNCCLIGDFVLSLPAIRDFIREHPGAEVRRQRTLEKGPARWAGSVRQPAAFGSAVMRRSSRSVDLVLRGAARPASGCRRQQSEGRQCSVPLTHVGTALSAGPLRRHRAPAPQEPRLHRVLRVQAAHGRRVAAHPTGRKPGTENSSNSGAIADLSGWRDLAKGG